MNAQNTDPQESPTSTDSSLHEREAALTRLKLGRNDPCPCGSGKKYKKCCLPKDQIIAVRPTAIPQSQAEEPAARSDETSKTDVTHPNEAAFTPVPSEAENEGDFQHPEISDEENRIANEWWAQVGEHYIEKPDGGEVLCRLHAFLDGHPQLFKYLDVEDEMLLELEPMLRKQGRSREYLALLRRVRQEQPETYRRCFGWFDYALIADAIARGALTEIPPCFSFFQEKAKDDFGHLSRVFNLLAWAGCESEVFELAERTLDIDPDGDNWAWDESVKWLCLREAIPLLSARACSPDDVRGLLSAQRKVLGLNSDIRDDNDRARHQLESAARDAEEWKRPSLPGPGGQGYADAMWNFAGWLVRHRGCVWASAVCLARLAWEHWVWRSHESGPKDPFQMNDDSLTRYFECRDDGDSWIGGVEPFAFIQAIAWFGDYLRACQNGNVTNGTNVRGICEKLHARALENHSQENPALRLYSTFDALIGGLKRSHDGDGPDR